MDDVTYAWEFYVKGFRCCGVWWSVDEDHAYAHICRECVRAFGQLPHSLRLVVIVA